MMRPEKNSMESVFFKEQEFKFNVLLAIIQEVIEKLQSENDPNFVPRAGTTQDPLAYPSDPENPVLLLHIHSILD